MERVPITEAASRLGVSTDTVRRRIRKGELPAHQQRTPQGYVWMVELPEDAQGQSGTQSQGQVGPQEPRPQAEPESKPQAEREAEGRGEAKRQETAAGEVQALQELVHVLQEELTARRREVQELHVLLQQAQALPPGRSETWEAAARRPWWRRLLRRLGGA